MPRTPRRAPPNVVQVVNVVNVIQVNDGGSRTAFRMQVDAGVIAGVVTGLILAVLFALGQAAMDRLSAKPPAANAGSPRHGPAATVPVSRARLDGRSE